MNIISIIIIAGTNAIYMLIFSLKPSVTPVFSAIAYILLFLLIVRSANILEVNRFSFINKNSITAFLILLTIILTLILIKFNDQLPLNRFAGSISDLFNSIFLLNNAHSYHYGILSFTKYTLFTRMLGITGLILLWLSFILFSNSIKENIIKILFLIVTPILYLNIIILGEFVLMISLVIILTFLQEKNKNLKNSTLFMFINLAVLIILTFINILAVLFTIIYTLYCFRINVFKASCFFLVYFTGLLIILYLSGILPGNLGLSYGLTSFLIICSIAALYIGWSVSDIYEVYFSSGILISLFIAALTITDAVNNGFNYILSDEYGLNLIVFLLPIFFFLVSIHDYRVDRFLGKLLSMSRKY